MESWAAMWTPGLAFVAPGPRVTKQTPGRPRELAVGFRHHGGPAFGAADQNVDRGVVQRVEDGQITLAGHAGQPLHSLRDQLIDQNAAAGSTRAFGFGVHIQFRCPDEGRRRGTLGLQGVAP